MLIRSKTGVLLSLFRLATILFLVLSWSSAQRWPYEDYDLRGGEVETENDPFANNPLYSVASDTVIQPIPGPILSSSHPEEITVPGLGTVRGIIGQKVIKRRPINEFFGLKYGVVSPGLGRFQRARAYEHNANGAIDATRMGPNCAQFPDLQKIIAAEARGENVDDCLTLNIYTPSQFRLLPVIVFIHGEMLFDGSATEAQPDYLLEEDVVLVSVNYRLAPFGFLATLTDNMPGNVALADIHLALEWLQTYIRAFGGNPEQITLMGQAGGATLVHALSLCEMTQGLFHKVILQSGTALNPFFLEQDPLNTARSFARTARCPRTAMGEIHSLNSCFERLSTSQLLETMKRHYEENEPRGLHFMGGFKLTVGDRLGYLRAHPAAMVVNRTHPMIIGVAKDAGAFIMSSFYSELSLLRTHNISDYINVVLRHTAQPHHYMVWKNLALNEIFTPEEIKYPTLHTLAQGLLELTNLIMYRGPVLDSIRQTYKKLPTYLYCFDYRGQYHRFSHLQNPLPFETDATLSDDNIYLFPYPEEVSHLNQQDRSFSRALVSLWANFATYGTPNQSIDTWPNVTSDFGSYLRFTGPKAAHFQLDYHFGDGISVPNLYPEFFTKPSNTTAITTTTITSKPYLSNPYYQQYPSNRANSSPGYGNYHNRLRTTVL